jgi:hypothetical protein
MSVHELVGAVAAQLSEDDDPPAAILSVALPYFFLRLTTICVERRELSVLHEFIIRSVTIGLDTPGAVAGFLGVQESEITKELDSLHTDLFISLDANTKLKVLDRGLRAVSSAGLSRTVVRDTGCYVHGATRRVDLSPGELMPRRRIPSGCLPLPSIPTRPPRIQDLDLPSVKSWMLHNRGSLPRLLEVSKLGRVVGASALFKPGFLILRRGQHSIPLIAVDGVASQELAQLYAPHPAILQVKHAVGRHEQLVKRTMGQHCPALKEASFVPSQAMRNALTAYISFWARRSSKGSLAEQLLIKATAALVAKPCWVSLTEGQSAFGRALVVAKNELVVAAPPGTNPFFDNSTLERLELALQRGVGVRLHTTPEDERLSNKGVLGMLESRGAKIVPMPSGGEWCGFAADNSFGVIGKTKIFNTSIGSFEGFFGAIVTNALQPSVLLETIATRSGVPVTHKAKKT